MGFVQKKYFLKIYSLFGLKLTLLVLFVLLILFLFLPLNPLFSLFIIFEFFSFLSFFLKVLNLEEYFFEARTDEALCGLTLLLSIMTYGQH